MNVPCSRPAPTRSLFSVLACLAVLLLSLAPRPAAAAVVSLSPSTKTAIEGEFFSLDVVIADVADLTAWQFSVLFNPSVVNILSVNQGPFLGTAGTTIFIPGSPDNVFGKLDLTAESLFGAGPGAAGAGRLATVNFRAVAPGNSSVTLDEVLILDSLGLPIAFGEAGAAEVTVAPIPIPGLGLPGLVLGCAALLGLSRRARREKATA